MCWQWLHLGARRRMMIHSKSGTARSVSSMPLLMSERMLQGYHPPLAPPPDELPPELPPDEPKLLLPDVDECSRLGMITVCSE